MHIIVYIHSLQIVYYNSCDFLCRSKRNRIFLAEAWAWQFSIKTFNCYNLWILCFNHTLLSWFLPRRSSVGDRALLQIITTFVLSRIETREVSGIHWSPLKFTEYETHLNSPKRQMLSNQTAGVPTKADRELIVIQCEHTVVCQKHIVSRHNCPQKLVPFLLLQFTCLEHLQLRRDVRPQTSNSGGMELCTLVMSSAVHMHWSNCGAHPQRLCSDWSSLAESKIFNEEIFFYTGNRRPQLSQTSTKLWCINLNDDAATTITRAHSATKSMLHSLEYSPQHSH